MMQLILGDCLEKMKVIADNSIDAILCDIPYGTTACKWDTIIPFEAMWAQLKRIRKDRTPIALFGSEPFSSYLRMSNINEFKYDWVYRKSQATNFLNAKKQPLRNHELISIFYKKQCIYKPQKTTGTPYNCKSGITKEKSVTKDLNITKGGYITINMGDRYPHTITKKYSVATGAHPTQKPVTLMEYLVKTYTNENDTVLDFTMGSGTTGIACKNLNRNFIGIELDPEYFKMASERLNT